MEFKYALGSFGLAAAALACSVAVAAAAGPVAEPVGPEVLSNLIPKIQNGSANGSALAKASGGGLSTEIQGNVATGWNFFNATDCEWYTNGTDNITYVFPKQGGYWFVENNIYATDTFNTACTNGNLVAVNVINSSTGAFNAIFTYPHP